MNNTRQPTDRSELPNRKGGSTMTGEGFLLAGEYVY